MSPSEGSTSTQLGPAIIYKDVKRVRVWMCTELGRQYAKMRMEFGPGSSSEFLLPLHVYDDLLKVERDLIKFDKGPRAELEG